MPQNFPFGPLGDLAQLDQDLLSLLLKRRRLLEKALKKTPAGPGRPPQAQVEKELWRLWQDTGRRSGLDLQVLRQIFSLIHELQPSQGRPRDAEDRAFTLTTRPWPVNLDIPGPADQTATRAFAILAAISGQPLDLPGVLVNDSLVDLVKALNQAGASLYWEQDALRAGAVRPCPWSEKSSSPGTIP